MFKTIAFSLDQEQSANIEAVKNGYLNAGLKYGWPADSTKKYDQGHWNRLILSNSMLFPYDHGKMPFIRKHTAVNSLWESIQKTIGPRSLLRCYINGYTFGTDGYAHTDDGWITRKYGEDSLSETAILYLNDKWDIDWAGETVIFDDNKEIEGSVLPRYGRVLVFDSKKLHAARPLSRICPVLRSVLVFKTIDKSTNSPEVEFLLEHTDRIPHSGGTFFEHLYNTMLILEVKKKSKDVCAAGMFHAIYGTEFFNYKNPEISREKIKELIGEYAESLVFEFCNLKNRLPSLISNTKNFDQQFRNDLLEIELANLREQNKNNAHSESIRQIEKELLRV